MENEVQENVEVKAVEETPSDALPQNKEAAVLEKAVEAGDVKPEYGLQDISQCEPCPEGRMCGSEGMNNLTQSQVCPDGHVCGAGTNKAMQFNHPCPAGYWCNPETAPKDQFSGICLVGAYCGRGTKGYLKGYFKCPVGFYCPPGTADATPEENACPYMTTTAAGAEGLEQCFADEVESASFLL